MLGLELTKKQGYALLPALQELYDIIFMIASEFPIITEFYPITTHQEDEQAEIIGTELLTVGQRFKMHNELVNALRINGFVEVRKEQMRLF